MTDEQFFKTYPDRQTHIRMPDLVLYQDHSRHVGYQQECEQEFRQLGDHKRERRRILLWRVPQDNPFFNPQRPPILKIPFLAFADETIEDTDVVLLPIIHEIMSTARGV